MSTRTLGRSCGGQPVDAGADIGEVTVDHLGGTLRVARGDVLPGQFDRGLPLLPLLPAEIDKIAAVMTDAGIPEPGGT